MLRSFAVRKTASALLAGILLAAISALATAPSVTAGSAVASPATARSAVASPATARSAGASPATAGVTRPLSLAGFQPESASFLTPTHGFVLGGIGCRLLHACRAVLVATSDGGAHWSRLPVPDVLIFGPESSSVNAVTFAGRRVGWLYGTGSGLWVTRDGGAHWRKLSLAGHIEDLVASSHFAYAIVSPPHAFASVLLRTPTGVNAWRRTGTFTGDPGGILAVSGNVAWFATAKAAWVSAGGASWHEYPFACTGTQYGLTSMAAADATRMRFLCTSSADFNTGEEGIEIMASSDGGKTEHLVGRKAPIIGDGGVIAVPPGEANVISFATSAGIPSWIGRSANGGKTWRTVLYDTSGRGWNSLSYVSATVGWIVLGVPGMRKGSELLRTSDAGRTWPAVRF